MNALKFGRFLLTNIWQRRIMFSVRRCRKGCDPQPTPNLINAPCRARGIESAGGNSTRLRPFLNPTQPRQHGAAGVA